MIEKWRWDQDDDTKYAYQLLTNHGRISDFPFKVWYDLVAKCVERAYEDADKSKEYHDSLYRYMMFGDFGCAGKKHYSGYGDDYNLGMLAVVSGMYTGGDVAYAPMISVLKQYSDVVGWRVWRNTTRGSFADAWKMLGNRLWPFTKGDRPFWILNYDPENPKNNEDIYDKKLTRWFANNSNPNGYFLTYTLPNTGKLKGEYFIKLAELINNYIDCTSIFIGCTDSHAISQAIRLVESPVNRAGLLDGMLTTPQIGFSSDPACRIVISENMPFTESIAMQSHFDVFCRHDRKLRTSRSFTMFGYPSISMGVNIGDGLVVNDSITARTFISAPAGMNEMLHTENDIPIVSAAVDHLEIEESMRSSILATLHSGIEVYGNLHDTIATKHLLSAFSDRSLVMHPIDRAFFTSESVTMRCKESTVPRGLDDSLYSSGNGAVEFGQPTPVLLDDSMLGTTERNLLCTSPGLHTVATATSVIASNSVFFIDPSIHYAGDAAARVRIVSDLQMGMTIRFEASATEQIKAVINEPVTSYRVLPDSNLTIEYSERALLQKDRAAHANSSITIQDVEQAIAIRDNTVDFNSNTTIDALSISGMGICMFENASGHVVEKGISNSEMYLQRIRSVGSFTNINETAIGKELTIKHGVDAFSATTTNVIIASNARTVRGLRHMRSNSKVLVSTYADADCSMYISAMGNVVVSERQSGRLLYQNPILFDAKTTVYDSESALVQFADRVSAEASAAVSHIIDADMETNITLNAVAAMSVTAYSNAILDKELPEGWINPRYVEDDVLLVRQLHYTFARYNLLYLDSLVARDTWAKPVLRLIAAADLVVVNIYHPDTSKWIQPIPVDTELVFYQTHTPWQKKDTLFVDSALPLFLDANASARDVTTEAVFSAAQPVYAVGNVPILEKKKSDSDVHSYLWEYPEQRIRTLVVYQLHSVVQDENSLEVV